MVSHRFKMLVKEELKRLDLHYSAVDLGLIEILEEMTTMQHEALKRNLAISGLKLLDDKRGILIDMIKTVIIEMIHQLSELPKTNYSNYISTKLGYS